MIVITRTVIIIIMLLAAVSTSTRYSDIIPHLATPFPEPCLCPGTVADGRIASPSHLSLWAAMRLRQA